MTMQEGAIYDTHAAIRRLTHAGMPEQHAEAVVHEHTHLMDNHLATKADIATVRTDIEKAKVSLFKWTFTNSIANTIALAAIVIAAIKLL